MVDIRRIEAGDGVLLRRIRLAALLDAPSAFASVHADEANRTDAQWSELAEARATGFDQATFLASVSGKMVGIVGGFRPLSDPIVELVSMWTAPGARRSGVGAALGRALLSWAQAGGARSVELWVTNDNAPAVRLYQFGLRTDRRLRSAATGLHRAGSADVVRNHLADLPQALLGGLGLASIPSRSSGAVAYYPLG